MKAEPERQEVSSADHGRREEPAETEPERQEASATDAADAVAAEDDKPETAIDTVLAFMAEKNTPLATEEIMEATGFAKRKVQDNLYRLKKRGDIEMVRKGRLRGFLKLRASDPLFLSLFAPEFSPLVRKLALSIIGRFFHPIYRFSSAVALMGRIV